MLGWNSVEAQYAQRPILHKIFKLYLFLLYVHEYFAFMYVFAPHAGMFFLKVRGGRQITLELKLQMGEVCHIDARMWIHVLGGQGGKQPVLITTEASLQTQKKNWGDKIQM